MQVKYFASLQQGKKAYHMFIEVVPVIPGSETTESEEAIDVSAKNRLSESSSQVGNKCDMYRVLVTGVPVSIHRYFALT